MSGPTTDLEVLRRLELEPLPLVIDVLEDQFDWVCNLLLDNMTRVSRGPRFPVHLCVLYNMMQARGHELYKNAELEPPSSSFALFPSSGRGILIHTDHAHQKHLASHPHDASAPIPHIVIKKEKFWANQIVHLVIDAIVGVLIATTDDLELTPDQFQALMAELNYWNKIKEKLLPVRADLRVRMVSALHMVDHDLIELK